MINSKEVWKPVVGYEELYLVSDTGLVKSLAKDRVIGNGARRIYPEIILKQSVDSGGYKQVKLCCNGKSKQFLVHKVVASAFLENNNGYFEVNHKDENKQNNNASNLEWCSRKYNMNYGSAMEKTRIKNLNCKTTSKRLIQYDTNMVKIAEYPSVGECARRTGYSQGTISACCCKKPHFNTYKGYIWRYEND